MIARIGSLSPTARLASCREAKLAQGKATVLARDKVLRGGSEERQTVMAPAILVLISTAPHRSR